MKPDLFRFGIASYIVEVNMVDVHDTSTLLVSSIFAVEELIFNLHTSPWTVCYIDARYETKRHQLYNGKPKVNLLFTIISRNDALIF